MAFSIARKNFYKFLGYSYLSTEKYVNTYSTSYLSTEKYVYITQTVIETLSLKTYAAVDFSILSIFRMIWVLKFTHLGLPIELKSDPSGKLDLSPQTSNLRPKNEVSCINPLRTPDPRPQTPHILEQPGRRILIL